MRRIIETRRLAATAIFDLEDAYARSLQIGESHPRPNGPIAIYLLGQVEHGQRRVFPTPLRLKLERSPSGYQLWFGLYEGPSGRLHRIDGAPAIYVVRVEAGSYQPVEPEIAVPQPEAAYFIDLQPGAAYPFPRLVRPSLGPTLLRGSLHRTGGEPIGGAHVEASGAPQPGGSCCTGDDGQWVLAMPPEQPSGAVEVCFTLPGEAAVTLRAQVVRGRETSMPHTGLRGWVVDRRGFGVKDALVRVGGHAGESRTDSEGRWYYYFGLDQQAATVTVTVTLPDGRTMSSAGHPVRPQAVTRVATFRDAQ